MRWLIPIGVLVAGAAVAGRRGSREAIARFRRDVDDGMRVRETQLREVLAKDTRLTLPGECVDDARAIEGR